MTQTIFCTLTEQELRTEHSRFECMRGFNQIVVKQLASCDKFLFHLETIFKWLGFFLKSQNSVEVNVYILSKWPR